MAWPHRAIREWKVSVSSGHVPAWHCYQGRGRSGHQQRLQQQLPKCVCCSHSGASPSLEWSPRRWGRGPGHYVQEAGGGLQTAGRPTGGGSGFSHLGFQPRVESLRGRGETKPSLGVAAGGGAAFPSGAGVLRKGALSPPEALPPGSAQSWTPPPLQGGRDLAHPPPLGQPRCLSPSPVPVESIKSHPSQNPLPLPRERGWPPGSEGELAEEEGGMAGMAPQDKAPSRPRLSSQPLVTRLGVQRAPA